MGRTKKKPGYDQNRIMEQFQNCIVEAYTSGMIDGSGISLRQVSEEFGITLMKTRKILITAGVYHTENSEKINSMREQGMSIPEIMKATGLSKSSVHSYLPYTKIIYNVDELSLYAERCRMYRKRKQAVEQLQICTVYPQVLTNVRVTDKKAAQDDADVQAAVKKVTEELGDTGRILVRESGTEPVVRVMVEAESEEICQKYVDMVVNVIKENGYVAG